MSVSTRAINHVIVYVVLFHLHLPLVHLAECGGKMHLREGEYERAHTDFFEAFKNYDESGSPRYLKIVDLLCFCSNVITQIS